LSRDNYNSGIFSLPDDVKRFAKDRYGSMSGLAREMGISPQHLHAYLSGAKTWGATFTNKLQAAGYTRALENLDSNSVVKEEFDSNCLKSSAFPDIRRACQLLRCTADDIAQSVGAPRSSGISWIEGQSRPSYDQLVMLYHQVLALAIHSCEVREAQVSHPKKAVG